MSLSSLKPLVIDIFAFSQIEKTLKNGVIGSLIGSVFNNQINIFECLPLNNSIDEEFIIQETEEINAKNEELKNLIKKSKYQFNSGIDFLGFYIRCTSANKDTIENKLFVNIWNFMKEKNYEDFVCVFYFTDKKILQSNLFSSNLKKSEKIPFKYQPVLESCYEVETDLQFNELFNFEQKEEQNFLDVLKERMNKKLNKYLETSIIMKDNLVIQNEKDTLESIFGSKILDNIKIQFLLPLSQSKFENLQNSSEKLLSIKENITMKVLLNKKANFFELKQKFDQELRKHFLPKLKILSKVNNLDLAIEECVKNNDFYPNLIRTKKTILKKKNIEIRDYLFDKELTNEINDYQIEPLNIIKTLIETDESKSNDVCFKILNKINEDERKKKEKREFEKMEEIIEKRKIVDKKEEKQMKKPPQSEEEKENQKKQYLILLLIVIGLILLRMLIN